MKLLIVALSLAFTTSIVSAQVVRDTVKVHHRHHRTTVKTTGTANARAHGGKAYAKGHRVHTNKGNHSGDIYFGPGKAKGKTK
jgi:hypothetical protein